MEREQVIEKLKQEGWTEHDGALQPVGYIQPLPPISRHFEVPPTPEEIAKKVAQAAARDAFVIKYTQLCEKYDVEITWDYGKLLVNDSRNEIFEDWQRRREMQKK